MANAYLIVFLGAGIGGAMRHGVNVAALRFLGPNFPFGTLTVNVVGSLIMGLLAGWFALKSVELGLAALYVLASVGLSILALFLGLFIVRQI